jgi:hypothetical protein
MEIVNTSKDTLKSTHSIKGNVKMLGFKIRTIRTIGILLLGFTLLLIWKLVYHIGCYTMVLPIVIGIIIMLSVRESFIKSKACVADCYFKDKSFFDTLMRGRIFVNILSLIVSLVLSLTLMLYLTISSLNELVFLFFDIFIIYILYIWLINSTKNSLNDKIRYSIIKDWVVSINSFLFLLVLIYIKLNSYVPSYIENSLTQSIENASILMHSSCNVVDYLVKVNIEKEAMSWWLMLNINHNIDNENYRLISWIIFLLNGGLSMFAYSRFMIQLLDFSYRMKKGDKNEK